MAGAFGLSATPEFGFEVLETLNIDDIEVRPKKQKWNESERNKQKLGAVQACEIVFIDETGVVVFS